MQLFPRLIPSSRVFTPGDYDHAARLSMGSASAQSNYSDAITSQLLQVTFLGLTPDNMATLAFHWASARGQFGVFALPAEIWNGVDNYSVFTPDGYLWKYTAPPDVEEVPCGLHDVSVELEMVPINASGAIVSMGIGSIRLRSLSPTISVGIIALTRSKILVRAIAPDVTGTLLPRASKIILRGLSPFVSSGTPSGQIILRGLVPIVSTALISVSSSRILVRAIAPTVFSL